MNIKKLNMKATEISLQVVKQLGNYESVRATITYAIEGEDTLTAIKRAKNDIDNAFNVLYEKRGIPQADTVIDKIELTEDMSVFERMKNMLKSGKVTIDTVCDWYVVSDDIKNKLLKF